MLKVNPNLALEAQIDRLDGYNSQYSFQQNFRNSVVTGIGSSSPIAKNWQMGKSLKQIPETSCISMEIMHDFIKIKALIFSKWQKFLQFTTQFLLPLTKKYKVDYDALVKERISSNVFSHKVISKDWRRSVYQDSGKQHLKQAEVDKKKFEKEEQLWKESFVI